MRRLGGKAYRPQLAPVLHIEEARERLERMLGRIPDWSALTRLQSGEYGVCAECGTSIPPQRLLAVPDATTCVTCQGRLERVGPR